MFAKFAQDFRTNWIGAQDGRGNVYLVEPEKSAWWPPGNGSTDWTLIVKIDSIHNKRYRTPCFSMKMFFLYVFTSTLTNDKRLSRALESRIPVALVVWQLYFQRSESKIKMNLFVNSGMEVAAFLSDKAASVAVVGKSDVPYQFSLGPDIGKMTMQVWEFLCFLSVHYSEKVSIF